MSHFRGLITPSEALYQAFASYRPTIRNRTAVRLRPELQNIRARSTYVNRQFIGGARPQKGPAEVDQFPDIIKNFDIRGRQVRLLDPKTNTVGGLVDRDRIVRNLQHRERLEQDGHGIFGPEGAGKSAVENDEIFLIQVGMQPDKTPICKIMERKLLILQKLQKKKAEKESAKSVRAGAPKEIEVNWAVSENDLNTKLRLMEGFLQAGKKVDIVLANKKRSRKATPEEAEKILVTIREKLHELGARESKPMHGQLLSQATLHIEKKP